MQERTGSGEYEAVGAVTRAFYEVVPAQYRMHCALNATVAAHALKRFGIACDVVPCQLWCAGPGRNDIVGFIGAGDSPGRWDGHAICASGTWFIDAALSHLSERFGVPAPAIIAGRRFAVTSQAIARHDLDATHRIWWHHPPAGLDPNPPGQLPDLVRTLGDALFHKASEQLAPAAAR